MTPYRRIAVTAWRVRGFFRLTRGRGVRVMLSKLGSSAVDAGFATFSRPPRKASTTGSKISTRYSPA